MFWPSVYKRVVGSDRFNHKVPRLDGFQWVLHIAGGYMLPAWGVYEAMTSDLSPFTPCLRLYYRVLPLDEWLVVHILIFLFNLRQMYLCIHVHWQFFYCNMVV